MSAHARSPEIHPPVEPEPTINSEGLEKKKGFFGSVKERVLSKKERLLPNLENTLDEERIEVSLQILGDRVELGLENATKSIKGLGEKGWEAVRDKAVPAAKAMLKNRIAQLSTVSGATGLLATMVARSTMKNAVLSGVRNVGNIGTVGMGTIAGAIVGGSWGGGAEFLAEHRRIKGERSFEAYQALLSQEEIEKLAPIDRAKRLVAAKSLLNKQRSRLEHKGFYGTEEQLEMLRARLHAIDISAAMSKTELAPIKNTYERLNRALAARDAVDKELSAEHRKDLELIAKCERVISAGVNVDRVKRGIKVGLVVGGLGGLAGSFLGMAFGSSAVESPKVSASQEDFSYKAGGGNIESQPGVLGDVLPVEQPTLQPEQAPAVETSQEVPVETSGQAPVVDAEQPAVPAPEPETSSQATTVPVETASLETYGAAPYAEKPEAPVANPEQAAPDSAPKPVVEAEKSAAAEVEPPVASPVEQNPSSFKLEKDQNIWGSVGKIAEQNGIKLTVAEQNGWTRKIAEFNRIGIKADGLPLGENAHFDVTSQIGEEIKVPEEFKTFIEQRAAGVDSTPGGVEAVQDKTPDQGSPKPEVPVGVAPDSSESKPNFEDSKTLEDAPYPSANPNPETQVDKPNPEVEEASSENPETPETQEDEVNYLSGALWGIAIAGGVAGLGYGIKKAWEKGVANKNEKSDKGKAHNMVNRSEKVKAAEAEFKNLHDTLAASGITLKRNGLLLKDFLPNIAAFEKEINHIIKLTRNRGDLKLWEGARVHLVGAGEEAKVYGNHIYMDITADPKDQAKLLKKFLKDKASFSAVKGDTVISSPGEKTEIIDPEPDKAVDKELEIWMRMGRDDKGIIGEDNIRNYGEIMRMDGRSPLDTLKNEGYLTQSQLRELKDLITIWGKLSDLDEDGKARMKQAFEILSAIPYKNPRSLPEKIISQIVSWDEDLLGPIAEEVDPSRKKRRVRR